MVFRQTNTTSSNDLGIETENIKGKSAKQRGKFIIENKSRNRMSSSRVFTIRHSSRFNSSSIRVVAKSLYGEVMVKNQNLTY